MDLMEMVMLALQRAIEAGDTQIEGITQDGQIVIHGRQYKLTLSPSKAEYTDVAE